MTMRGRWKDFELDLISINLYETRTEKETLVLERSFWVIRRSESDGQLSVKAFGYPFFNLYESQRCTLEAFVIYILESH